jgi:hypothetical protein
MWTNFEASPDVCFGVVCRQSAFAPHGMKADTLIGINP